MTPPAPTAPNHQLLLLTGAPLSPTLHWAETNLLRDFLPPWRSYLTDNVGSEDARPGSSLPAAASDAAWRVLAPARPHLHLRTTVTAVTAALGRAWQNAQPLEMGASFLTASSASVSLAVAGNFKGDARSHKKDQVDGGGQEQAAAEASFPAATPDDTTSPFYEHSYAVHDDVSSSFITDEDLTDDSGWDTYRVSPSIDELPSPAARHLCALLAAVPVTALDALPTAAYLASIVPATMTVNLIAAVIQISARRTVQTRRAGRAMDIVEMVVGDETRAGFTITFWLPPDAPSTPRPRPPPPPPPPAHNAVAAAAAAAAAGRLPAILSSLRPGQVVLAQNVALSSFRGCVYGQSLRRDMTRLFGLSPRLDHAHPKIRRVRDWMLQFVAGAGVGVGHGEVGAGQHHETLPPDTQD
ncbi:MAG: hypothetical protein M1826_003639 [Phylliscum demangeonii]|nr:MAG: hypothetical protein M1826_003639 [Phylliscum demangeonii]